MKKRILGIILALAMAATMIVGISLTASAAEGTAYTITLGDFTISPTDGSTMLTEGTDYSYIEGKLTVNTTVPVTIGMRESVTATNHVIVVDSTSGEANITFTGISIATTEDVAVTVKGGNEVTFTFSGSNALKAATDGIEVASNTPLAITGADNGELSISNVTYGISQNGYTTGGSLTITGNIKIDIVGCTSHAIYYRNTGSVTVSEGADVNIDTTKYAIYAHGINVSGGTVTVKNDDGYAICGASGSDIMISASSVIHIIEAKRGIYTDGGKITITDSANVKVYGGTESNKTAAVVDCAIVCDRLLIDENAVVEAYTAENAISGGLTTITDNAKVIININCTSSSSKHAIRFDSPLTVSGNATVDIDISGSKIYGLYDITDGTANISGNAVVTINGAYRSAYVDFLNLSDSASVTFEDDLNYAVYGEITLKDSATFTATSTSKKVLYDPFTVTPESGKAYMVKAGASEEEADTYYFFEETTSDEKSAWRYFYASVVDVYTVTVDQNIKNGTVSADQNTKAEGETVTLTITPAEGYELDTLTVKDASNNDVTVTENAFTMPASNVTVTATFIEKIYTVTVDSDITNGTVESDKAAAVEGDTVTLTVTPADGYKLASVTVTDENGTPVTVTDNKFTMPASNVTVTATFKELGLDDLYALVTDSDDSSVQLGEITKLTDEDGDGVYTAVVRVTITEDLWVSFYICDQDGRINSKISSGAFLRTMNDDVPEIADVIVKYNSATNALSAWYDYYKHSVVIGDILNGKVTVDKTFANDGETVTITVTPDSGYILKDIDFEYYELTEVIKGEKYTATIPNDEAAYKLYLRAYFKKNVYAVTVNPSFFGDILADKSEAQPGEKVTLTVLPDHECALTSLVVLDENGEEVELNGYTFVMPESNVTVTATFEEIKIHPVSLYFKGNVKLEGGELAGGSCKFVLKDDTGRAIETVKCDENGDFEFKPVSFYGPVTNYCFTLTQIIGDEAGVTYDEKVHEVYVTVINPGDGYLEAEIIGSLEAEFINKYTAPEVSE